MPRSQRQTFADGAGAPKKFAKPLKPIPVRADMVCTTPSMNGANLNHRITAKIVLALGGVIAITGCADNAHVVVAQPRPVATVAVAAPPVAVAPPMAPVYEPAPYDAYISVATNGDIVFFGGNTYIWYVGHDRLRHRQFYGHGDLRAEIFHRREALKVVMAQNHGQLPHGPVAASHAGEMHVVVRHPVANHAVVKHVHAHAHAHAPLVHAQAKHAQAAHAQASHEHDHTKHASNEKEQHAPQS
jgi:hypothetical protein